MLARIVREAVGKLFRSPFDKLGVSGVGLCHSERSEESGAGQDCLGALIFPHDHQTLRFAQGDKRTTALPLMVSLSNHERRCGRSHDLEEPDA